MLGHKKTPEINYNVYYIENNVHWDIFKAIENHVNNDIDSTL